MVGFGFKMCEILIFKRFLSLKIQINSQKTRLWKEKSVEKMITLGQMTQAKLVYLWNKVVCFVLSCWDLPNHNASCYALNIFEKLLMRIGASTWFETNWSYNVEAIDYWTIFQWKLNIIETKNYIRIWGHSWCCWKAIDELDLIELFHNFQI